MNGLHHVAMQQVSSSRAGRAVFLGLLTLLALLAAQIFNFRLTHENKIRTLNQDLASAAIDLSARFENTRDFLSRLSESLQEGTLSETTFIDLTEQHMHKNPEVIDIFAFDASGGLTWNSRGKTSSALAAFEPDRLRHAASPKDSKKMETTEGLSDMLAALPDASRIFKLEDGSYALSAVETSFRKSEFVGFFVAVIEVPFFVQMALKPGLKQAYSIQLKPKPLNWTLGDETENAILSERQDEADLNYKAATDVTIGGFHFEFEIIRLRENSLFFTIFLQALSAAFTLALLWSLFMLVRDNSRRKELGAQLETARASAEAASRAKSELIANVSHELRTPIGAIQGFADILAAELREIEKSQVVLETTSSIRRNCGNLLELVDDLLDLSKLEAGLFVAEKRNFSLLLFLNEIFAFVSPSAAQKRLALTFHALSPLPTILNTDSRRLRQILLNLLSNAIKFTASGKVTLEASYVSSKRILVFAVCDTGPGISEAYLTSLFEPFRQGDASVNRKHGGTGLGLALSKKLAQGLGAELALKDTSARGTTFSLELKLSTEPHEIVPMDFKPQAPIVERTWFRSKRLGSLLAGRRVLVVEDCLDNQRIYSRYLEFAGSQVMLANSGKEAFEILKLVTEKKLASVDAILMDLQMPEWDGFRAVTELKKLDLPIPILGVSASAFQSERERCAQLGFAGFMLKPVEPDVLVETIATHIHRMGQQPKRSLVTSRVIGLRTAARANARAHASSEPGVEDTAEKMAQAALHPIYAETDTMRELSLQFATGLRARVAEMRENLHAGSMRKVFHLAHQLKGTARNYGYEKLAQLAERIEVSALGQLDEAALAPDCLQSDPNYAQFISEIEAESLAIARRLAIIPTDTSGHQAPELTQN